MFPGRDKDGCYRADELNYVWHTVRSRAGLEDGRLHDLRHSFASHALALGETLPRPSLRAPWSSPDQDRARLVLTAAE